MRQRDCRGANLQEGGEEEGRKAVVKVICFSSSQPSHLCVKLRQLKLLSAVRVGQSFVCTGTLVLCWLNVKKVLEQHQLAASKPTALFSSIRRQPQQAAVLYSLFSFLLLTIVLCAFTINTDSHS